MDPSIPTVLGKTISESATDDPREEVLNARKYINAKGVENQDWEATWVHGATPWEGARSGNNTILEATNPLVLQALGNGGLKLPTEGKAIVPGCGTGYDAAFLASQGMETIGLDISPTGINQANQWLAKLPNPPSNLEFKLLDFFEFKLPDGDGFAVGYDFTFMCALPPSFRPRWAKRWSEILKPAGLLLTLEFPIDDPPKPGGPPYSVSHEMYSKLLSDNFELIHEEDPSQDADERRKKQKLAVWKRNQDLPK